MKKDDVVLVHDDVPRATWRMAVIQDLIIVGDGLVRAANVRTTTGITSRPITKLYPLKLSVDRLNESMQQPCKPVKPLPVDISESSRPQWASTMRATNQVREWARVLAAPWRMLQRLNSNF